MATSARFQIKLEWVYTQDERRVLVDTYTGEKLMSWAFYEDVKGINRVVELMNELAAENETPPSVPPNMGGG